MTSPFPGVPHRDCTPGGRGARSSRPSSSEIVAGIPHWGIRYDREMAAARTPRSYGYSENKNELLKRLARVEGQVRGIARMVEEDRYCIDILTQLAAVDTALESVALEILDDHVKHCVAGALASGDETDANAKIDELLAAVRRFAKTR